MKFAICVVFCVCVATSFSKDLRNKRQLRQVRKCEDSCILLRHCDPFLELIRNKDENARVVIKENRCGREGARVKVCCPDQTSLQDAFFPAACGSNPRNADKIIGGEDTKMGEFPWVAALEYKSKSKPHSRILCSGSLINARYVLTAAHCLDPKKSDFELHTIRLGEWNLTTKRDCFESQKGPICAPAYIAAKPEKIIPHSKYDIEHENADDIALIRLDRTIDFVAAKGYILPICLPSFGIKTELLIRDRKPIVIGWGRTKLKQQNDILLKAELPIAENELCKRYFYSAFGDKQLCVGGGEKDSCDGDSGSPLILEGPIGPPYLQIGIVSFGTLTCGTPGVPAVYTSVSHYKNWIAYNMEAW